MSQTFLDIAQTVGYDFEKKTLIITLSDKMAQKMKSDGWNVGYEEKIGHFVHVTLTGDEG
jgi:hypothetical protein